MGTMVERRGLAQCTGSNSSIRDIHQLTTVKGEKQMQRIKLLIALMLVLLLASAGAGAEEARYKMYGSNLRVDMTEPLPDIATPAGRYVMKPFMPSPEVVRAYFDVVSEEQRYEDDVKRVQYTYTGADFNIYARTDGSFTYDRNDYMRYRYLLYMCFDAADNYHPEYMITDYSALSFMTPEEAEESVDGTLRTLMPEIFDSFDVNYAVYPMHAADMQRKVEEELTDGVWGDDLEFYRRKFEIYEGCIADDDECYFVNAEFAKDGMPVSTGYYTLTENMDVYGMGIHVLIDAKGIIFVDTAGESYYISDVQPLNAQVRSSEELLESTGEFLDNLLGVETVQIDKVEAQLLPYPIAMYERELVPMLKLSYFDADRDRYMRFAFVNALTGEILF